jgi:hypothetical protein
MMGSPSFSASAGSIIWLLISCNFSCMIFIRRLRIGIKNARWYIGTTGGNWEAYASLIRFMIKVAKELHHTARKNVLVDLTGWDRFHWNQMRQAVVA